MSVQMISSENYSEMDLNVRVDANFDGQMEKWSPLSTCLHKQLLPKLLMGYAMRKIVIRHMDSKGPVQPAHLCSLIMASTVR